MSNFIVEQRTLDGWDSTWSEAFETEAEAMAEILDHVDSCIDAVNNGFMEDAPSLADFRIVKGGNDD
jgi:hypothetical protein